MEYESTTAIIMDMRFVGFYGIPEAAYATIENNIARH
jgi:hypothetical protein